ncbi:MAG: DUF4292 domain-containing protein [Proteobacteria bacterium]|nr:DUF4292 domain-containing protein [Cystobacterineae bacterium]MCL2259258.1 DUF4292 domain-containing protein [Cystobacterineae bacterium]MCL2314368.1 DUF4292 domain-containing protein [Pseudomonadota bacterium]
MSLKGSLPLILFLCCGCAHNKAPLSTQMSAKQLVVHIEREASKARSIKGQARLKIDSPQQKGVVEILVAAQRPDSIHLELLDGLGRPVRIFVSQGGRFSLWDIEGGAFFRGVATQKNLERFLPLYFAPVELVQVLLGAPPLIGVQAEFAEGTPGGGGVSLLLTEGNILQGLRVQAGGFQVMESEVRRVEGGEQAYKLTFASFMRLGAKGVFPEKRVLEVAFPPLFLELNYTDYSLNGLLESQLFILAPPQGVRVVDVEENISLGEGS